MDRAKVKLRAQIMAVECFYCPDAPAGRRISESWDIHDDKVLCACGQAHPKRKLSQVAIDDWLDQEEVRR